MYSLESHLECHRGSEASHHSIAHERSPVHCIPVKSMEELVTKHER